MALGPLMVDVQGFSLSDEEREILQHPSVGGVILFTRNYESPEQLKALTDAIRDLRTPHLLISVDHEGGRVQRFRAGFSQLPPVSALGTSYQQNPDRAVQQAERTGWLMAVELRAMGVDFSFAPVLDLNYGVSEVIGDRSFHRDPDIVTTLARAYIRGMKRAWMPAVGKHFPGHGAVEVDTHVGFAVDDRHFEDILGADMVPFKRLMSSGDLLGVMPAHVVYEKNDTLPAGFSPFWIQTVLRERLAFQGAILSDDLSMMGASIVGDSLARVEAALSAGCDMVLLCNHPENVPNIIDNLKVTSDPIREMRLTRLHGRHAMDRQELMASTEWHDAVNAVAAYMPNKDQELDFA
jgi:beta-N-acetylhexosaminidase